MAYRGRSPVTSDFDVRSNDSSPDPLAMSFDENKAKSARKATPRRPLGSTSPSKQNRRGGVSEFEFSSPSKAMVMNTPRMGSASPWRIKVTVHAEPGSDDENAQSPSVKRVTTRTQTTTVPLKDPDASSPVKRGRGRPRKSDVGATPKLKRAGTPKKRAARSKSRDLSTGATDANAADVDTDAPPKRRRGRPRKNAQPPVEDEDIIMEALQIHDEPSPEATPIPTAKSKPSTSQKSTRFATPLASVPDIETTDATPQPPSSALPQDKKQNDTRLTLPADRRRRGFLPEYELPVIDTPPRTELGDRLRARKNTPHAKKAVTISSDEESDQDSDVLTPTSGEDDNGADEEMEDPFTTAGAPEETRAVVEHESNSVDAYPEIEGPVAYGEMLSDQPTEDDDEELQDATNFAFDEGTTRMPDDTTVMDSENFSMISVESLPHSGGLTSPPKAEVNSKPTPQSGSMLRHEYLEPSMSVTSPPKAQQVSGPSPKPLNVSSALQPNTGLSRPAFRRFVTPVIDAAIPSAPPEPAPVQVAPPKAETPGLGRVVTAGVALQGVLDPSRLTPEPSQKMLDDKRDRLDDLFRGFSDSTRKELQAGLRLGEQLAQGQEEGQSSRDHSSPIKPNAEPETAPKGVFKSKRKHREPRLLTPEDHDDFVVTEDVEAEGNDVQYPILDSTTEKSLPSPARSENEMSWQLDSPPAANINSERRHSVAMEDQPEQSHGSAQIQSVAHAVTQVHEEDYGDIWQEEASRSSNSAGTDNVPQVQDLFEPGPVAPARGKLPRTWRRESGNHFQYSDEAESPQQHAPVQKELVEDEHEENEVDDDEDMSEEDDPVSDGSDDTGMFFQSNMPNIFSKRHSRDLKQRKTEKLDLTLLMNEGASLVPESSPPVATKKSSPATKTNPFLNTPPRFSGFPSSPHKSSPLRRELRSSELSSEAHSRFHEESSLPLPQSSPFHTYVDGESKISIASDQRQLQMEMGDVTASSIRRVRNEADGYLEAYEAQERSLNEIEEVTELSRTHISKVASSPPRMKMLSPVRKRVPLFQPAPAKPIESLRRDNESESTTETASSSLSVQQPSAVAAQPEAPQQRPTVLTRMTSSLWSTVTRQDKVVKPHPILSKLSPLPKVEPWTKTHYKTLDRLYAINQKHLALFSPNITPPTPLSQTNAHLLQKFLNKNKQPYVGAVFAAWGYEFDMTEELVVLCQVFCELMSLDSVKAYETLKGREIEMGDCLPGKAGDLIDAEEVMRRLATVILGEEVRADEKEGVKIDRTRGLEIRWPQQ
ncbi:hypothetical protein HBI55_158170 [Parastagonospora nodorum]|nr:hypothetical protein HBI55_158170 [Parastagonospora nodorum]